MRKLCFMILLVLPAFTQAQNQVVDSLLKEIDKNVHDSIKLKNYEKLSTIFLQSNVKKAREFLGNMQQLAITLKDENRIARSYYLTGYSYFFQANYEKALENYLEAAKRFEALNSYSRLSDVYTNIGSVYLDLNDLTKGREYFLLAEATVLKTKDSLLLGKVYSTLGHSYDKSKRPDSALVYLAKAEEIFVKKGGLFEITNVLISKGLAYKHLNKTTEALNTFNEVKNRIAGQNVPKDIWAVLYNNIGSTYLQAKQYSTALPAFDSSIVIARELNASGLLMENYRNLSDLYKETNDGGNEAAYLRKYYTLKDSLFTTDSKNQLTQLEADYQLEKKNTALVKTEAEVVKRNSQRNVLFIIVAAALLILAGLAFFYSRIRKQNAILNQQNATINDQNTALQTLNNVKDRLFSIISHDLRNPLVTLQSYLTLSENANLPAEKKEQYRLQTSNAVMQTSNMLDNLLAWANMQIKNTKASITPIDVDELVADTKSGAQAQAAQKQIIIHQDLAVTSVLGDYNILSIALRNLLTNAIKFSDKEGNIWINAEKKNDHVLLSVKDEGIGMTAEQLMELNSHQQQSSSGTAGEKGSGLGLYLVQELLQKINARLEVKSEKGRGSTFEIILPA